MNKRRWQIAWLTASVVAAGAALLWRPAAVAGGVSRGLAVCGDVLIPSLFPFLVLGGFLTRSGVSSAVGRCLETVTRAVFGLPGCCAAGILLGAVGGYPAGGAVVGELFRGGQIDREQARRMLRFCVNGGPGFVIGAVGAGLTGSTAIGVILFFANVIASLTIGIAAVPRGARRRTSAYRVVAVRQPPATALVDAVTGACESLLSMCGFVLLFAAVTALVDVSGLPALLGGSAKGARIVSALISCVLEVSGGCSAAAPLGELAGLLLGFSIGFGGLSVHCQLAAALHGTGLIDGSFFLARLAQGMLTAVLSVLLLHVFPVSLPVWGALQGPIAVAASGSAAVSAALLVLAGVWMLTVGTPSNKQRV